MGNELDALGFAAAQGGAGLAKLEVVQAGVAEGFKGPGDPGHAAEELDRLLDGEVERLGDVFTAIFNVQRLAIKAGAATGFAADKGGREEVHLKFDIAGAFAFGTTTLRAVEGESAGGVAAKPGLWHLGVELPDLVEKAD